MQQDKRKKDTVWESEHEAAGRPLTVFRTEAGILAVVLNEEDVPAMRARIASHVELALVDGTAAPDPAVSAELDRLFRGVIPVMSVDLDLRLTTERRQDYLLALQELLEERPLDTVDYTEVTERVQRNTGRRAAPIAAGQAMSTNPLPLAIRCDRVEPRDGSPKKAFIGGPGWLEELRAADRRLRTHVRGGSD